MDGENTEVKQADSVVEKSDSQDNSATQSPAVKKQKSKLIPINFSEGDNTL